MSDNNLVSILLIITGLVIASIIPFAQGFKTGYERCMIDAVANKCASIVIVDGEIKYEWAISASATAELK